MASPPGVNRMVKEDRANIPPKEDIVERAATQARTKNVTWLTTLAKQAYEQRRIQNCLSLTRAILLIDPENEDARALQSKLETAAEAGEEFAAQHFEPVASLPSPGASDQPLVEGEGLPGVPSEEATLA